MNSACLTLGHALQAWGEFRARIGEDAIARRLETWTANLHRECRGDPRYSRAEYDDLEREQRDWERRDRARECAASLRDAARAEYWTRFELEIDDGRVPTTGDWNAYLASGVRRSEVAAAIDAASTATSPSPADGAWASALKNGGPVLELALAAVFDTAMRTGMVPAS